MYRVKTLGGQVKLLPGEKVKCEKHCDIIALIPFALSPVLFTTKHKSESIMEKNQFPCRHFIIRNNPGIYASFGVL